VYGPSRRIVWLYVKVGHECFLTHTLRFNYHDRDDDDDDDDDNNTNNNNHFSFGRSCEF